MLLQVKEMTHYFGGLLAVSDFNLELEPGELVGIIGPNGAGKTTIFNLITGVYHPPRAASLENTELVGKRPNQITDLGIARTFQNIRLFNDLTVLDNVRIAAYHQVNYNPLEAMFHLGRFLKLKQRSTSIMRWSLLAFFKLEDYADELAKNLPYGLQRRLEIARAMATQPKLLLLDEPAAGINPNEIDQLMEFIQWIRKEFNLTIILIEHQMRLVMGICETHQSARLWGNHR